MKFKLSKKILTVLFYLMSVMAVLCFVGCGEKAGGPGNNGGNGGKPGNGGSGSGVTPPTPTKLFMFEEEMTENIKSMSCDILLLREKTGLNRREFADYFGIPYRTVEDWENKKSSCSSYLYNLIKEKIDREF
jgi:hypothetical protein